MKIKILGVFDTPQALLPTIPSPMIKTMTLQSSCFLFFFAQILSLVVESVAASEKFDLAVPPPPPSSFWRFSPVRYGRDVRSNRFVSDDILFSYQRIPCRVVLFSIRNLPL